MRTPRMAQLVGRNCVRCGERIPSELDARFCTVCGSPVHNGCARASGEAASCTECGAAVSVLPPPTNPTSTPRTNVPPKSPTLAFTLNFFLPGTGLWYLGWPGWGGVNFVAVLLIGAAALGLPAEVVARNRMLFGAVCSGGSGGLAMALANRRNALNRLG